VPDTVLGMVKKVANVIGAFGLIIAAVVFAVNSGIMFNPGQTLWQLSINILPFASAVCVVVAAVMGSRRFWIPLGVIDILVAYFSVLFRDL
jgi:hypothetical protein